MNSSDDDFIVMQIRVKGLIGRAGRVGHNLPSATWHLVMNAFELIDFNRIEDVRLFLFCKSCQ